MLKTIVAGALLASSLSLQAQDGFGVEVGSKVVSSSEKKFLGIQKLSEIVGEDGQENFIEGYYQIDNYKLGMRYTNISEFDENKLELIAKLNVPSSFSSNLTYNLGIGFGFGEQASKRKTISTDMTASKYITSSSNNISSHYIDTEIYTEEANYLSFAIQAGVKYKVVENFYLNAGIESETKYWNLHYRLTASNDNVFLSGLNQRSMKAYASLEYRF